MPGGMIWAAPLAAGKPIASGLRRNGVPPSLIEGRRVSRRQVRAMLQKVLRQHTMCRRRKIDQTVAWLNEAPP